MYPTEMNHSANEGPLDARTQNTTYSKSHYGQEEEIDPYQHQIPQQSFEGVHGENDEFDDEEEDYREEEEEEYHEEEFEPEGQVGEFLPDEEMEDEKFPRVFSY